MASVLTPSSAHYPRGMPYDYGYPDMLMQQQQQQQQQQLQHQQHQGLAPYGRYSHDMYASGSRRAQSHMTFESEHAGYGYPDERSFAYYEDPGFGSTSCPPAGPSFDVDFELELAASQALGRSTIADPSDLSELKFPELPADLLDSAPEYEFSAHTRANVFERPIDYEGDAEAARIFGLDRYDPSLSYAPSDLWAADGGHEPFGLPDVHGHPSYTSGPLNGQDPFIVDITGAPSGSTNGLVDVDLQSSLSSKIDPQLRYPSSTFFSEAANDVQALYATPSGLNTYSSPPDTTPTVSTMPGSHSFDIQPPDAFPMRSNAPLLQEPYVSPGRRPSSQPSRDYPTAYNDPHSKSEKRRNGKSSSGKATARDPTIPSQGGRQRMSSWQNDSGFEASGSAWPAAVPPGAHPSSFAGGVPTSRSASYSAGPSVAPQLQPTYAVGPPPPPPATCTHPMNGQSEVSHPPASLERPAVVPSSGATVTPTASVLQTTSSGSTHASTSSPSQSEMINALGNAIDASIESEGVARCPYPNCSKTFAKNRSYNLKAHLRSHSQLKPFACSSCPRAFSRKHDLERHARVHSGDKPYICEVCGKGFPRSDALRRHWRVEKECGDKAQLIEAGQSLPSLPPSSSGAAAHAPIQGPPSHVPSQMPGSGTYMQSYPSSSGYGREREREGT